MTQETNKLENGDMTREEFHVSSLVVLTQPDLRHALAERIRPWTGPRSTPSARRASWW